MNLAKTKTSIPTMSAAAINAVRELESAALQHKQEPLVTHHVIHSGVYLRTIRLNAGLVITGALIKTDTTLIISGDVMVYLDGEPTRFEGYHVVPASAGRKQAIFANEDTDLTMLFGTDATNVEDAENQFTDEVSKLISNKEDGRNTVLVTGA